MNQMLERAWLTLWQQEKLIENGRQVVRKEAAERLYAGLFHNYDKKDIYKPHITKEDFMNMYTPKYQSHNAINEDAKTQTPVSVVIKWQKSILVDKFKTEQLSSLEKQIANGEQVIYLFIGEKKNGKEATDVGQTSRALHVRTMEHIKNGDYLEGYPLRQKVFAGNVTATTKITRALLEQIEGEIIDQVMDCGGNNYHICNKTKTKTHSKPYRIRQISNENRVEELKDLLISTIEH